MSEIDTPFVGSIIGAIDAPVELHIIGDRENRHMLIETTWAAGANVLFHRKYIASTRKKKALTSAILG